MTEDPRIDPADLRNVRFPGSSRRYDARAVDQFLETVAARIAATNDLVDQLQGRIADLGAASPAPAPAPPPPQLAHLDDDELVRLVGEETASVLSTARRAADEIRSKAEEAAARMIRESTAEADRLSAEAKETADDLTRQAEEVMERATTDATAEADRIRSEAAAEADATKAQASELAEAELATAEQRRAETDAEVERVLEEAREEGRGMVQEAKEVRTRVLDDLQRRRDAARDQIERLLAGRERLLAAYGLVRENLDDITAQLADSLPDPGEPEQPDGFVGIVGSSAPAPAAEEEAEEVEATPDAADRPIEQAELDDTVAAVPPATSDPSEPEPRPGSDADLDDDERVAEASEVDDATGPVTDTEADIAAASAPDDVDLAAGDDPEAAVDPDDASAQEAVEDVPVEAVVEDAADATAEDSLMADLADPEADQPAAGDDDENVDPEDVAPTELEADRAEDHAAGAGGDVDELFARLRAEREQSVAKARAVVGTDSELDEAAAPEEPDEDPDQSFDAESAEPSRASRGDVDRVPAEFLAGEDVLTARAEALEPLDGALNRALKRRLADEQNELLDLLRRSGATTADALLPDLTSQVAGYAGVASEHLAAAAVAGGAPGGDVDVAELATALGAALVEPFRRRVERSTSEVDGDPDELDERLRALYREWKVQHIAPVAEDALLSAYAVGTLRSAEPDGRVRWLIDPDQGPCPDAQDNALAGEVRAGEAFATGDVCPQAHPGCRCVLAVD